MVISSKQNVIIPFRTNREILVMVNCFKYLGALIEVDMNMKEIECWIEMTRQNFIRFKQLVCYQCLTSGPSSLMARRRGH